MLARVRAVVYLMAIHGPFRSTLSTPPGTKRERGAFLGCLAVPGIDRLWREVQTRHVVADLRELPQQVQEAQEGVAAPREAREERQGGTGPGKLKQCFPDFA